MEVRNTVDPIKACTRLLSAMSESTLAPTRRCSFVAYQEVDTRSRLDSTAKITAEICSSLLGEYGEVGNGKKEKRAEGIES
jgi:hypothetical protein